MSGTGTHTARQFLDAVDAACADLGPADRARLVGGLEEHLAELSADGVDLVDELGDPVAYAAELRSAAGLPATAPPAAAVAPTPTPMSMSMPPAGPPGGNPGSGPSTGKVLLVVGAVLAGAAVLVTAALLFGGLLFFSSSSTSGSTSVATVSELPAATVPEVTGLDQAQARQLLEEVGLVLGSVTSAPSPDVEADHVLSQSPAAGAAVPPGTTVDLVVASGP